MDIRFFHLENMSAEQRENFMRRSEIDIAEIQKQIAPVIEDVRREGDPAIVRYTEKFDRATLRPDAIRASEAEFEEAFRTIKPEVRAAIERAIGNIRTFHERQMPEELWMTEIEPGVHAGEKITPIASVGLYVPRGKGSFPSVMMMLGVPAVVAGVPRIIVCTPPTKDGGVDDATLVAARLIGIKDVYKVGGVLAIAAMAYGTQTVPKVHKCLGPGSAYTSAAKRLLYGRIDVGLPAGPSESIILADETCDPHIATLDLLIEAEHGPDSSAVLVTHSERLAVAVRDLLPSYVAKLPEERQAFIRKGMSTYGGIVVTGSLEASLQFLNDYAPEHLEVLVADPMAVIPKIRNAGEILIGRFTPITIGNFTLGPNAILPTGGFAKTFSCVSVHDFLKRTSVAYCTEEGYRKLKPTAQLLAEYEGFPAHVMALRDRGI